MARNGHPGKNAMKTRESRLGERLELPEGQIEEPTHSAANRGSTIGTRLRAARQMRNISQTKLAELIGRSTGQISMVEHDRAGTSIHTALAAAEALGVSMDYLVGLVDDPTPTRKLLSDARAKTALLLDLGITEQSDDDEQLEFDSDDFIGVNEIVATAGTGSGRDLINERIIGRIKFRRPWMESHGLEPELCRVITVLGESMEPTLPDGASILFDTGQQEPRDRRIFVMRMDDDIVAKRLIRHADAGWLLKSDNPDKQAWPTVPWPDEARIVGEVRWLGRALT